MAIEAKFAVIVLTAPPPGLAHEAGGAFVRVDNRECLLRSCELFLSRPNVVQTVLVVSANRMADVKDRFGPHLSFSGVKLVTGGPRWVDQIAAVTVAAEATRVIVHDAARPVVPAADIDAIMAATQSAVTLAVPVRTPLVELDDGDNPVAVHGPRAYRHLLTPQAFDRPTFDAMGRTKTEPHPSAVTLMIASPLNVRVGSPADAALAKACLSLVPKPKGRAPASPFEEPQW